MPGAVTRRANGWQLFKPVKGRFNRSNDLHDRRQRNLAFPRSPVFHIRQARRFPHFGFCQAQARRAIHKGLKFWVHEYAYIPQFFCLQGVGLWKIRIDNSPDRLMVTPSTGDKGHDAMHTERLNQIYALQIALAATIAAIHDNTARTPNILAARHLRRRLRDIGA
jgi:hypothetical protein